MMRAVLAADLGAGSLRMAAVGLDGAILARRTATAHGTSPAPDRHEADAELWWQDLVAGFGAILAEAPSLRIEAVAITAMTRSEVFLDARGATLRPAILWRDRRATRAAATLASAVRETNPALALNPFHPLARLAWLAEAEPDTFARLAHTVEPKDFLNFRLTGRVATDTVVAGRSEGLRRNASDPVAPLLALLPAERLAPWEILGPVAAPPPALARLAGVPVVVSSMDTWAASVGAGAAGEARAYDVSGTSEAVGLITPVASRCDGLVTLPWAPGLHQLGGPTQAGADAVRWAHATFRAEGDVAEALERAAAKAPSRRSPLFLPYLLGERAPVWRTDVEGAFFGLRAEDGPDDFLLAAMEGVAHAVRDLLAAAEAATGTEAQSVHICGGGALSDGWCRLRADVLGKPVVRPREVECGLLGAAAAAAVAIGAFPSLPAAADAMNPPDATFAPHPERAALYAERAALYGRLKAFALAEADGAA